ncbi:MAG: flagellar filament capping protein FliD [Lachnospira sp.]|nr:flagellar filament capping protein FliD [Lachnospira sp.]
MPIRLSGLSSGMDTESLVKALVSGYNVQKDNLVKARTRLEWKQDAWKTMNTSIYNFYKGRLSAARLSKTYNLKKASISNSNIAKVSAASNAVTGSQTLKVTNLAAMGYLTGGKISAKPDKDGSTKVTGSTKLSDITGMDSITGGSLSVAIDGKRTDINIDKDLNVNQFIAKLKDAGISASFDEGNQRFFVSAAKSGKDHDFSITANDADGLKALQSLGLFTKNDKDREEYNKWASYADAANADELAAVKQAEYEKVEVKVEDRAQAYADKYNDAIAIMDRIASDDTWAGLQPAKDKLNQDKTEFDNKYASFKKADGSYDTSKMNETQRKEFEAESKAISAQESNIKLYEDSKKTVDATKDYVKFDKDGKAIANPEDAKIIAEVQLENENLKQSISDRLDAKVAYSVQMKAAYDSIQDSDGAVRIKGDDAIIELNGATFVSNTNNFSINGLTIQVTEKTDTAVTITTEADIDAVYDNIKEFFKEYNTLIMAMDTAYNADSSKGYEPLTSEEKEAMTDDEVEKWEKKIKDALLRKDSTLGGASSAMKTLMNSAIEINGKKYSLASFGIKTQGYFDSGKNEKGVYHIDGDPDDTVSAGNDDKLKAMLASDPDVVIEFFSKLSTKVYDDLGKRMNSTKLSSMYTLYNDKQMATEYSSYNTKIKDKEEYITRMEDYYYKKFTAMETALAKLNQTQTSLSGFFS